MAERSDRKRALMSVTNKNQLPEFAKVLARLGWEIISTGGTAKALQEAGVSVIPVEQVTGFPEMMRGRLKTLHPKVFGGILAGRSFEQDMEDAAKHAISMVDMVVVNLYQFELKPSIEEIDIGGPSLLRAAAKNCATVVPLASPSDYAKVSIELLAGGVSLPTRVALAGKVFVHTAAYDAAIARWFMDVAANNPDVVSGGSSSH